MEEQGLEIQCRSMKLFSAFFSKKILSEEIIKYEADDGSVSSLITLLRVEAAKYKTPFEVYATQFVIQAIEGLINACSTDRKKLVYTLVSRLARNGELCIADIQSKVNEHPVLISPHILVELDKIGAISFLRYFENSVESKVKSLAWADLLFELACNPNSNKKETTLFYLLASIVKIGFEVSDFNDQSSQNRNKTAKLAVSLLSNLTKTTWDYLWESPENQVTVFELPDVDSQACNHFNLSNFQNCYLEQLTYLISYKPEIKAATAIKNQHDWTFFKSPKNVVNFIIQFLIPLEVDTVLAKIDDMLNHYEINWKTLLLIISTVQVCYAGNRSLKVLINKLAQRGLENLQTESLLGSFLFARQINAENTSSVHYGSWFSSITSTSTTSKQFAFFMKFLSSTVRHEPAWVLIAHKNNSPTIPMVDNCRQLWTDYTALIRTRLEDLKMKNPAPDQVTEEDITLIKEVDSAIAAYAKSGRIPSSVIEAAIFRKPYFVNKFLPTLLKPRRLPDPPDVREDFIEELKKSGKLPLVPYDAYIAACHQMEKQIPAVENMDWESNNGEASYPCLMNQIACCNDSRQQSLLVAKLDNLLLELLPPLEPPVIKVIEFNNGIDVKTKYATAWKIAESWIESIQLFGSSENQLMDGLNRYFLILCRHPSVVESLYYLLWDFIRNPSNNADTIRSYGIVMCLLSTNAHILLPVRYQEFHGDFIELLMGDNYLAANRAESMLFHLQLLFYTVTEAKRRKELGNAHLPASIYLWLARRILHSEKSHRCQKYLSLIKDAEFLREAKLSLNHWLRLEMIVEADKDVLSWSERSGYLHSVMKTEYQSTPLAELGPVILGSIVKQLSHNSSDRSDCSKDLLLLLQSVVNENPNASDSSTWLSTYWKKLRHEQGTNVDQLLWSLVCSLPPYLLSRNSYDQAITENSLKNLVTLIEDWRNSLAASETAWFPKYITIHLIQSLKGLQSFPLIPCLQFSAQIHCINDVNITGSWRTLEKALNIFHPFTYDPASAETIQWANSKDVDLLTSQLMALSAVLWCTKNNSQDWPPFIEELGLSVSLNPELLKGWKLSYWVEDDCVLPWIKILPTYLWNLLPFVLVKVLITWSDLLIRKDLPTAIDYIFTLVTAHNQWIQTTHSFIDSLSEQEERHHSHYPVGKILDFESIGILGRDIKLLLNQTPIRVLKALQQSSSFRLLETDWQLLIKQRCS